MPLDLSRVKAVCFDVDGTLIDTDDQFVQRLVKYFTPVNFLFRHRDVLPLARRLVMFTEGPGNWMYSLADRLGLDNKLVTLSDRFYDMGGRKAGNPCQLIDGVREMLVILSSYFPLSIVSARGQKSTLRFLSQFELVPYFKAIATGQTCSRTKPYPDPILWAAQRMDVPASACLMIGDTPVDILTGKRAGAQTVGVLCGFGEEKELVLAGADLILNVTSDLTNLFSRS